MTNARRRLKKAEFLARYAELGTIQAAADVTEINRATHYTWLADDPDYAQAFDAAGEIAVERLEQEARRRAVDGVDEPVFYKGDQVASVRKYSDTLLIFLLKAARPERYRERFDVTTRVVTVDAVDAEIAKLESELERRAVEGADSRSPSSA